MKQKVLVLLYSEKQLRTYVETTCFSEIQESYDLSFLIPKKLLQLHDLSGVKVIPVDNFPKFLDRSGTLLASSLLWRNRFRTKAHYLRASVSFGGKQDRVNSTSYIVYNMDDWFTLKRLMVRFMSISLNYRLSLQIRKFFVSRFMNKNLKMANVDVGATKVIFIPFSGILNRTFDDLIQFFNEREIITIAMQENWDNLSSKTFIDSRPFYFCVWGQQSAGHLRSVHNLTHTHPVIAGTPRFSKYMSIVDANSNGKLEIPSEFSSKLKGSYILFTGTGDGVDDSFILDETLAVIKTYSDLQVVYRPHPYMRIPLDSLWLSRIKAEGVIVDLGISSKNVFHHCGLIANATLVINQFSTMLLEALSCNRKVLLPSFINRPVKYDYSKAVDDCYHFIGLSTFPNVFISRSREGYSKDLQVALEAHTQDSSRPASWMAARVDTKYVIRELVDELLPRLHP